MDRASAVNLLDAVGRRRYSVTSGRVSGVVLAVLVGVYLVALYFAGRGFYFYVRDEWLLFSMRADPSASAYFRPFNGHLIAVPVLVYQIMLRVFGLGSYAPWLALAAVAHVTCVVLIFEFARRRAGPLVALGAAAVLLFFSQGAEDLFWAFQIGFLGSLALGLLAILLAERRPWSRTRAIGISACLVVSIAMSGVGLVMMVVVLALVRRPRDLLVFVPPVAIWAIWWTSWSAAAPEAPSGPISAYALAANRVIGELLVSSTGPGSFVAPIVVAAAALGFVARWRPSRWTIAGIAGVTALYASIGLRGGWLPVMAEPSRYRYVGMALILLAAAPIAAQIMERGAASRFAHRAASGVVVTAIIIPLTVGLVGFPGAFRNWEFWSLTFLAQARVVEARSADVPLEIKFDRNRSDRRDVSLGDGSVGSASLQSVHASPIRRATVRGSRGADLEPDQCGA